MSIPAIAAISGSTAFAAASVTDLWVSVPVGILLLAGFAAFISLWWAGLDQLQAAVTRAVRSYLTGSELEEALREWPRAVPSIDDSDRTPATVTVIPARSPKHRRGNVLAGHSGADS